MAPGYRKDTFQARRSAAMLELRRVRQDASDWPPGGKSPLFAGSCYGERLISAFAAFFCGITGIIMLAMLFFRSRGSWCDQCEANVSAEGFTPNGKRGFLWGPQKGLCPPHQKEYDAA